MHSVQLATPPRLKVLRGHCRQAVRFGAEKDPTPQRSQNEASDDEATKPDSQGSHGAAASASVERCVPGEQDSQRWYSWGCIGLEVGLEVVGLEVARQVQSSHPVAHEVWQHPVPQSEVHP